MTLRARWKSSDQFLVRHVDRSILVVEKRAGLLTHATDDGRGPNLHDQLREFVIGRGRGEVLAVHRLDRVVSGLLVYARNARAQARLSAQFEAHSVDRIYTAAAHGKFTSDKGTLESNLYVEDPSTRVYSVREQRPGAKHAVTHWRVLERFAAADVTLLEVELETGVRNQIRVQLAEAGHPLLGERKYHPDPEQRGPQESHRIFLHAGLLGFLHPDNERPMRFEAPLHSDLERWKRALALGQLNPRRAGPKRGTRRAAGQAHRPRSRS